MQEGTGTAEHERLEMVTAGNWQATQYGWRMEKPSGEWWEMRLRTWIEGWDLKDNAEPLKVFIQELDTILLEF